MQTIKCKSCDTEIESYRDRCPTCFAFIGFPSIRDAEADEEVTALNARYQAVHVEAAAKGTTKALLSFEKNFSESRAVINVGLDFLKNFFTSDTRLYSNYQLAVTGESRIPAADRDDKCRRVIDAFLFGGYADQIRFAALSLDGNGLSSYGPFAMQLKEKAIRERASLLEDNSFHFMEKHDIRIMGKLPPGYRATWPNRYKLAVSKLAWRFTATTSRAEHPKILLTDSGNRADDDFIEIHIYGPFNCQAVESVKGPPSNLKKVDKAILAVAREKMKRMGCEFVGD